MQIAAYVGLRARGVRGAITSYLGFGLILWVVLAGAGAAILLL